MFTLLLSQYLMISDELPFIQFYLNSLINLKKIQLNIIRKFVQTKIMRK